MLIRPSFKKSLIVEQFQGNYLKTGFRDVFFFISTGGTPYPAIDNKELLRLLKDGYRMEKPDTCDDEL